MGEKEPKVEKQRPLFDCSPYLSQDTICRTPLFHVAVHDVISPRHRAPRHQDVAPPAVAAWTSGETLDGDAFLLPEHSLVTSRFDPARPRGAHYALVCYSPAPLTLSESTDTIVFAGLRNLLTGRPVGPSQVTAVVHWFESWTQGMTTYGVAMRARLVYPYFIRLAHPLLLPDAELGSSKKTGLHQTCSD